MISNMIRWDILHILHSPVFRMAVQLAEQLADNILDTDRLQAAGKKLVVDTDNNSWYYIDMENIVGI